jgi:hypothetical protein
MLSKTKSKTAKQISGKSKTIKSVKPKMATIKGSMVSTGKTTKPAKAKPKKEPKYKNTLLNRLKEDWNQPIGGYNYEKGTVFGADYDKYPYGSLTGRGKSKKKKKK